MTPTAAAATPAAPPKKTERAPEKGDSAAVDGPSGAPTTAASATPATARLTPETPKESPAQLEAKALRGKLGHLVDALAPTPPGEAPSSFRRMGAALYLAFVAADIGLGKTSALTAAEVKVRAEAFQQQNPTAWGAAMGCNVMHFVTILVLGGLIDAPDEDAKAAVRNEFHGVMSKLSPV